MWLIPVLFTQAVHAASQPASPFAALNEARRAIHSFEAIQTTEITDDRLPGRAKAGPRVDRIWYRSDLGKARRMADGPDHSTAIAPTAAPPPSWLFTLPEESEKWRVSTERVPAAGDRTLIQFWHRKAGDGPPAGRVELNEAMLPGRVVTFGANGEPLDEILVTWQRVRGVQLPAQVTYRFHSVQNLLVRTTTYRFIALNGPVSATLFDPPR